MQLADLFALGEGMDDHEHQRTLDQTGFWGKAGAGCLFLARDTGRFLVAHRSREVEQPNTRGTWGGAIDAGEDPVVAVRREAAEEAGFTGSVSIEPLLVFRKGSFRYHNFLATVAVEFSPRLNWESQGSRWCDYGQWPTPLHFGLASLLDDAASATRMQELSTGAPRSKATKTLG